MPMSNQFQKADFLLYITNILISDVVLETGLGFRDCLETHF